MVEINQAVIFAGGLGERLRPLTNDKPKPMVAVNDRPFLEHLINLLKENGISEVLILLGYLPQRVQEYFGDGSDFGIKISYHVGKIEDATGTRLNNAKHLLQDHFLLMYGDNYWPMDLHKMIDFYNQKGVLGSVAVYNNQDNGGEYGVENNLKLSPEDYILQYYPEHKDPEANGLNMGFYIMNRKVLDFAPTGNFSFEEGILVPLIAQGQLVGYRTDHPYYWMTTLESVKIMEKFLDPKKVVFLDRDGVINKQMPPHDYVKTWDEFEFLSGVIEALSLLTKAGYQIFIITNQRGISRGLMTEDDLTNIHHQMIKELVNHQITVNGIYHCPHNDTDNCNCRKPKAGLLFKVAREHYLDLTKAILIGDSETDIQAGITAGCRTILLQPGVGLLGVVSDLLKVETVTTNK